ncbi:MAG: choline dehydrogenase [Candidatus Azotimanducaceae bacterium WSBS_2022_MAG_OTU7]
MKDFIIVGAGSAGSVLARRLSGHGTVTLIEAGPPDHWWDYRIHMPAALSQVLSSKWYNWHYESEPEPCLDNRKLYCPRGKVMGGSSSVNGMIFVRGNRGDFDRWSSEYGLSDWDYESCLPYFRKSENALGLSRASLDRGVRGSEGPLKLSRGELKTPLFQAWLDAVGQAGFENVDDFNGRNQEGAGCFDRTIFNGERQNVAKAYLGPVQPAGTLEIIPRATVTRVITKNGRATAVDYLQDGKQHRCGGGEVILCGGAINTPHLLMLSGIGDAPALKSQGIPVISHSPGVGQNLMDHLEIYVQYACNRPVSVYPKTRWFNMPLVGLQWLIARQGAGATNHFETGAFLRSGDHVSYPDLQFHFLPIAMDYDGKDQYPGHGFQVHVGPMKPTSRGEITLCSANPLDSPRIQFNYNATQADRSVMRSGIRMADDIVSQSAFDDYRGVRLRPTDELDSDNQLDRFVRQFAESAYHPSGTCRMGIDDAAVVDAAGLVRGVSGLRVVDASIMPEITNGNLNAPVVMMAEKISDSILSQEAPRFTSP